MPGLFGIVSKQTPVKYDDLLSMARLLKPAVPGISEIWLDKSGMMGWGREVLDYILPEGQPLEVEGRTWLLVDGEIADCRDSKLVNQYLIDTYHKRGRNALGLTNGGICVGIWEQGARRLTLLTDGWGLRPLFYLYQPERLAFSSEIKALLALGWLRSEINEEALAEWLAFDTLDGDRTLFSGIKCLPAGSMLVWEQGHINVFPYVTYFFNECNKNWKEDKWSEAFIDTLRQSLHRRLFATQEGYFLALSGGIDSRLLLAAICTEQYKSIPLVTYGDPTSRDVNRARDLGNIVGFPHQFLILDKSYPRNLAYGAIIRNEGFHSALNSHGLILNKLPDSYHVLILGNCIELFMETVDSRYSQQTRSIIDPFEAYMAHINRKSFKLSEWEYWLVPEFVKRYRQLPRQRVEERISDLPGESLKTKIETHHLLVYSVETLRGLSLIRPKFEYTEPYLDSDLTTLMLSLPLNLRKERYLEKLVLSWINPFLARVDGGPLAQPSQWKIRYEQLRRRYRWGLRRLGFLQDAQLEPPSSTFSNLHNLLRLKPNRQWVEDMLLRSSFLERGWFRPQAVRQAIYEHMRGIRNHTRQLGAMITLELVMRLFIDGS